MPTERLVTGKDRRLLHVGIPGCPGRPAQLETRAMTISSCSVSAANQDLFCVLPPLVDATRSCLAVSHLLMDFKHHMDKCEGHLTARAGATLDGPLNALLHLLWTNRQA